jgi:putative endonuclease
MKNMSSKKLGKIAEKIAEKYLKNKGYQILDKNFNLKFIFGKGGGEIDLIAKKDDILSFVEVKSSFSESGIQPENRVNFLKRKKIIKVAKSWLAKKRINLDQKWQIDVISLKIDPKLKKAKIYHFKNINF